MFFKSVLWTFFIMWLPMLIHAQTAEPADTLQQQEEATTTDEGVTELGVTEIKITIEKPQVKLFSDRIQPEFEDVHLQKSFREEIVGGRERLILEKNRDNDLPQINIEELENKRR